MGDDSFVVYFLVDPHLYAAAQEESDCLQGQTALQLAAAGQHGAAMEALIEHGCQADADCREVCALPWHGHAASSADVPRMVSGPFAYVLPVTKLFPYNNCVILQTL